MSFLHIKKSFPILDWIRGLAAVSVFVHHFYQQYSEELPKGIIVDLMSHLGAWGVAIFFVLSGFCIHWARLMEVGNTSDFDRRIYAVRRFFRIYPAFFLSAISCFLLTRFYSSNLLQPASLSSLLLDLSLTSSFVVGHRLSSVNNVFWSVVAESHFYILYGLLWRYFNGIKGALTITLVSVAFSVLTFLVSVTVIGSGEFRIMLQNVFLASWWSWCLGACVAEFIYRDKYIFMSEFKNRTLCLLCLILSLIICLLPPPFDLQARRFILPVVAAGFIYFLLQEKYDFSKAKKLIVLGAISYSLYLLHPVAIWVGLLSGLTVLPAAAVVFPLGILFAYASYRWIEIPFIATGREICSNMVNVRSSSKT